MKMTEEQYERAASQNMGYCTRCDALTTKDIYPDELDATCTKCMNTTCMGVEEARTSMDIEIEEESEVGVISFGDDDSDDYEDSDDE